MFIPGLLTLFSHFNYSNNKISEFVISEIFVDESAWESFVLLLEGQ
jgi:hypothetical protein